MKALELKTEGRRPELLQLVALGLALFTGLLAFGLYGESVSSTLHARLMDTLRSAPTSGLGTHVAPVRPN